MIYRDYLCVAPPGFYFFSTAVFSVFGPRLIALFVAAFVLRLVSFACLYLWLVKVYRPASAALAVITAAVVASGDVADYIATYHYLFVTYAVVAGYFASNIFGSDQVPRYRWAVLSGLVLAACFSYKQTGVVVAAAVAGFTALACCRSFGFRKTCLGLAGMLLGLAAPLAAVVVWLAANDALPAYLDQVFLTGPASKGGLVNALLRPLVLTFELPPMRWGLFFGLLGLGLMLGFRWLASKPDTAAAARPLPEALGPFLLGILAVLLGKLGEVQIDSRTPLLAACYLALLGSFLLCIAPLRRLLRGQSSAADIHHGLPAVLGFATAFALAMSWPAFEPMVYPGLAVVLAFALAMPLGRLQSPVRNGLVVACLALIVIASWRKHVDPMDWGNWEEPPLALSTAAPAAPQLRGLHLSPATARFFDEVSRLIQAHSGPADRIFTFPHLHIFYVLADRQPVTFASMHWLDVCPDQVAVADAERLAQDPPAVIVAMDITPETFAYLEGCFRDGKPSGQRQLAARIEALTQHYELVGAFLAPGTNIPIKVWAKSPQVRPDRLLLEPIASDARHPIRVRPGRQGKARLTMITS
jgi:hypothetical protein